MRYRFIFPQDHLRGRNQQARRQTLRTGMTRGAGVIRWYQQCRLEEVKPEALDTVDVLEKLGAADAMEVCRELLR